MEGYKGHKPGSRKEAIHKLFDESGLDAAQTKAAQVGLSPATIKIWTRTWAGGTPPAKVKPEKIEVAPQAESKLEEVLPFATHFLVFPDPIRVDGVEEFSDAKAAIRRAKKFKAQHIFAVSRSKQRYCKVERQDWVHIV